jgi:hypothetical protein
VQFSDEENPTSWIQGVTLGEYEHPVHGKIKFDAERIKRFADNVNNNVRGTELDIDYDHKAMTTEAAGWVKKAEARANGLFLLVEWTRDAANKIKSKKYRYFSPEFVDEWKHPGSGATFTDVLFGGGITNRPFLKDILPVNLSELFSEEPKNHQGGNEVDRKKLCELLGLPEDSNDDVVSAAIKKLNERPPAPTPPANDPTLVQLAESNPAIKALMERQAETDRKLAETQAALRLSEVLTSVTKLSEGKNWAFPAVVLNELPAALIQMPKTLSDKVVEVLGKLAETGLVQLGEKGHQRQGGENETDPVKVFTEAVGELMKKDDKMSYGEAVEHVALMEPSKFEAYRKASYASREN